MQNMNTDDMEIVEEEEEEIEDEEKENLIPKYFATFIDDNDDEDEDNNSGASVNKFFDSILPILLDQKQSTDNNDNNDDSITVIQKLQIELYVKPVFSFFSRNANEQNKKKIFDYLILEMNSSFPFSSAAKNSRIKLDDKCFLRTLSSSRVEDDECSREFSQLFPCICVKHQETVFGIRLLHTTGKLQALQAFDENVEIIPSSEHFYPLIDETLRKLSSAKNNIDICLLELSSFILNNESNYKLSNSVRRALLRSLDICNDVNNETAAAAGMKYKTNQEISSVFDNEKTYAERIVKQNERNELKIISLLKLLLFLASVTQDIDAEYTSKISDHFKNHRETFRALEVLNFLRKLNEYHSLIVFNQNNSIVFVLTQFVQLFLHESVQSFIFANLLRGVHFPISVHRRVFIKPCDANCEYNNKNKTEMLITLKPVNVHESFHLKHTGINQKLNSFLQRII